MDALSCDNSCGEGPLRQPVFSSLSYCAPIFFQAHLISFPQFKPKLRMSCRSCRTVNKMLRCLRTRILTPDVFYSLTFQSLQHLKFFNKRRAVATQALSSHSKPT